MESPEIRTAAAADIPAIAAIYSEAVLNGTASYEIDPPPTSEMLRRFEALATTGFPYLVAVEAGGTILGYAYAGPFRPRPAYRFAVENSVYVARDARGMGIGRVVMERLIVEVTMLGFRQIIAVIGDGSPESASVRLHERLGFRHSGRLEGSGYKHGRWLDTVFMQLSLNGGNASAPSADAMPERHFLRSRS